MDEQEGEDVAKQKILEAKKAESQIKSTLRIALDELAYERMMNISHSNKERYLAAVKQVFAVYQRIGRRITDAELLRILQAIKERTETETRITFHKK
jgi:DNA-binding TFAR19-related protein (PDSD5 family)